MRPKYTSDFEKVNEGFHLFQVNNIEFTKDERGTLARIDSTVIESADNDNDSTDVDIADFFPLWTNFGGERLLGFLVKAAGMPDKEYPNEYFESEKTQSKVEKKAMGVIFGGEVKHRKMKDSDNIAANIVTYISKKEYEDTFKTKGSSKQKSSVSNDSEESDW